MAIVAGLFFVALPAAAATHHPGSLTVFVLFQACFTIMLALSIPRPRSYAYTFLALLLFLGFWLKFNLHTLLQYPYQEPIGSFDGSGASWDTALTVASCGAIGVIAARLVQLAWRRQRPVGRPSRDRGAVPGWFCEHRRTVLTGTAVAAVALILANLAFAFYAIGIDPRLVLPAHANVIVGWLIKLGLGLWIATLVHWELQLARARPDGVFLAPIAEAATTSVSCLSRGIYLFHVIPYCLVLLDGSSRPLRGIGRRRVVTLAVLAAVGFVLSLGAVSALRLLIYPSLGVAQTSALAQGREPASDPARAADRLTSRKVSFAVRQVRGLFVERWNGIEGVMAISSHPGLGADLLLAAVKEDPARGQDALYQRISKASALYEHRDGYTFLTLPGIMGILGYAGSSAAVVAGMAALTALVLGIEGLFQHLLANRYVASLAGFAMASELTQANFPYLLATFFVLLFGSLATIAALTSGIRLWHRADRDEPGGNNL